MSGIPGWAVAGAILILENDLEYYTELTEKVLKTGCSTLCSRDGVTPWETLPKDMRNRPELFCHGSEPGFYGIKDPETAVKHPEIRRAMYALMSDKITRYEYLMRVVLSNFSVEEETLEEFRSLQNELSRVISFYHPDLLPSLS
jgi:hypothetical protein